MLQKLSGNTEDSQLIRHGMKAHLIFELYSTLLVPFGKLQLEFFISSGISNLLHILTTNVQFYLNLMSFVSKCHGIIKDLNYLHS